MRVDTGFEEGNAIPIHYDPMIAKLIVWGEDRVIALGRMRAALAGYEIVGVQSNVEFLARTVASKAFSSADLDTGLIERNRAELLPADAGASDEELAAAALAELLAEQAQAAAAAGKSGDPYSPWNVVDGWRLNLGSHLELVFAYGEKSFKSRSISRPPDTALRPPGGNLPSAAAKQTACCRSPWAMPRSACERCATARTGTCSATARTGC